MARERMAKLLKYDHFERHWCHMSINFDITNMFILHMSTRPRRFLGSWTSGEDLEQAARFASAS